MHRRLAWLVLCAFGSAAYASTEAVIPTATQHPVQKIDRVDTFVGPTLDLARIGEEDLARDQQNLPPRYAIPQRVSITPSNRGTWEDLGNGQMLWRLRIQGAEGTTSLNLGFTRFHLSDRDRLLLYSADGSQVLRPFTATDNEAHGELWTPPILTNDLVVELTVAKGEEQKVDLVLGSINQGYRGFGTISSSAYNKSGSCNLDVECLDAGDAWRSQVRAVGVISTGGSTFCSGSLINDTSNDHKMYFITANHCGIAAGNAPSLVVFWNYQNSFCRTPGSAASGATGDGSQAQFHTGSFFRAGNATSDFTLVELDDPPVPAFNHFWEGWDRTTGDFVCTPGSPCATIHHPNTDEKRITYVTTNTATTTYLGTTSPGDGTHVWAHWATDPPGPFTVPGVTEPGSSGSPLFTAARRFIGQLHGGLSACGSTGDNLSDYYGRFSLSWTGGGTDSTRVSNWLDAAGTGAMTLDGVDQCTAPGAPAIGTASATGANQIQVSWSDGTPSSAMFRVYRAFGTCAAPGAFTQIAGPLAGSPYNDNAVSGGSTYAYHVTGLDPTGSCESAASGCVQATATGACTLPPTFAGLTSATNPGTATCGINLSWSAATANCGGPITYNVYRSTTPGFTPSVGNRIATGLSGTSYLDTGTLVSGTTYYYIVRAVDGTTAVEDGNTVQKSAIPTGTITTSTFTETFEGGGGFDNPGWSHAILGGTNDWVLSTAQSQTPTHSWFAAGQTVVANRVLTTPSFGVIAGTELRFWHRSNFETNSLCTPGGCCDGGTLEISTNGGGSWTVVPDAAFTAGGFNGTISAAFSNPLAGARAWCDDRPAFVEVRADLSAFAGSNAMLRWHAADDSSVANEGWFVDSVTILNAGVAGTCMTTGGGGPTPGYFTLTPCRQIDTRTAAGPFGGPIVGPNETRTYDLRGGTCTLPADATAAAINITVTGETAVGSLKAYPADQAAPSTSVINFRPSITRANNAIVSVDSTGAIKVVNSSNGNVHFILDIVGYFVE